MILAMAIMRARFEYFSGSALAMVIIAAVVMGTAALGCVRSLAISIAIPLILLALIVSFARLPMLELLWLDRSLAAKAWFYFAAIGGWVVIIGLMLFVKPKLLGSIFALMIVLHVLITLWFLAEKSGDGIDVYLIQKLGAQALLHGHNPFAITFPDIYGPKAHFYPPGIVWEHIVQMPGGPGVARDVQCGYFYMPMSLLLALPGYLCGDVRYSNLICLEIAAILIAYARPSKISFLCAILVLLCPGMFFMLINAWLEPQMLMLLAAAVFLAVRGYRVWSWVMLGLLLAEKQYMILAVPVFVLMQPQRGSKPMIRALLVIAITASVIILPFFFWSPHAFLHSATALYVNLIRTDAISIPAWLKLRFDIQLHLLVTAGIGAAVAIVTAWRGRRDPASFAAAMAFVLTVSFLFSTQAFLNYYFFSMGCLATAIAVGAGSTHIEKVQASG